MMGMKRLAPLAVAAALLFAAPAAAHVPHTSTGASGAGLMAPGDAFKNFMLKAAFPLPDATSSDLAFWGDRAFAGNYGGFRIFDISGPVPTMLADVKCNGAQGDPSVWDRDKDGEADLLILSVDRTMAGPECGAPPTASHADPTGWEGLRIFDVSDPANVTQIATVYQDCGSHTHTLIPRPKEDRLLVLNSSYPLRPGPTCGPVRGPEAGRDPLHGVVQVVEIPLDDPTAAREITELPITYPGDPDNNYLPFADQGLLGGSVPPGAELIDGMRACHDITVFIDQGIAGGACAEQAQVWRLDPKTGLPDTANPLWVYDQDNVDFWHSATFSWDGKVVNFIDESFGEGCPPKSVKRVQAGRTPQEYETGNMFFLNAWSGEFLSEFRLPRSSQNPAGYCSAHLGNAIPSKERYLLANAWYDAGSSIVDFTDPRNPKEIAYGDRTGAGTWSTYWYEQKPKKKEPVAIWANDGVGNAAADRNGFEAWLATIGDLKRKGMKYLNPQTQEKTIKSKIDFDDGKRGHKMRKHANKGKYAKGKRAHRHGHANGEALGHLASD